MGYHAGAHSASEKAKTFAIGAIIAGLCALAAYAAYLCYLIWTFYVQQQ